MLLFGGHSYVCRDRLFSTRTKLFSFSKTSRNFDFQTVFSEKSKRKPHRGIYYSICNFSLSALISVITISELSSGVSPQNSCPMPSLNHAMSPLRFSRGFLCFLCFCHNVLTIYRDNGISPLVYTVHRKDVESSTNIMSRVMCLLRFEQVVERIVVITTRSVYHLPVHNIILVLEICVPITSLLALNSNLFGRP